MKKIFLGTDSGATTSKTSGVWEDGSPISLNLAQSSTNSQLGTRAVVEGWVEGVEKFLAENQLTWSQVEGVGLAMPGPYQSYGVLDRASNLPESFAGWNFLQDYTAALAQKAGRHLLVVTGNDGNFGGVAEAAHVRGNKKCGVLMLAPGSGLGAAYTGADGLSLNGDTLNGMEAGHMPAPLQILGLPRFTCGCGRDWGCFEAYTTISGLPQYLNHLLPKYPRHELHNAAIPAKEKALSLRTRAQKGDPLALEIFDLQAKAMGLHVANLSIAFLGTGAERKGFFLGRNRGVVEFVAGVFRQEVAQILRQAGDGRVGLEAPPVPPTTAGEAGQAEDLERRRHMAGLHAVERVAVEWQPVGSGVGGTESRPGCKHEDAAFFGAAHMGGLGDSTEVAVVAGDD